MPGALAFLITWTCYGAWLHGDERLSVDDAHRAFGTELAPPDPSRMQAIRNAMTSPPIVLTTPERHIVHAAITDHCRVRDWWLGALNVRSNHVHCVVAAGDTKPERIMQECKSWATRRLRAHNPQRFRGRVWTRHASTRYLLHRDSVQSAIHYVVQAQDNPTRWCDPAE